MKILISCLLLVLFLDASIASCERSVLKELVSSKEKSIEQENIIVEQDIFSSLYEQLNQTLSGNLATVFRSEWKAKESFSNGIIYLKNILNRFHGSSSLLSKNKNEIEQLEHLRVQLSKAAEINGVRMRDLPGPSGSKDRTFTYYTKSILGKEGGKHQVRLRTYVRSLNLKKIGAGESVLGFFENSKFLIERGMEGDYYKLNLDNQVTYLNYSQLIARFGGEIIHFYPVHGKKLKLEVKTKLPDQMVSVSFPRLQGDNYVQKLSVGLTFSQAQQLFGTRGEGLNTKLNAIEAVASELRLSSPHQTLRTQAIFDVLREGLRQDPQFMEFTGATEYGRLALEVKLGEVNNDNLPIWAQTTLDFDMKVRQVYLDGHLINPRGIVELNRKEQTLAIDRLGDQLHIELKVPKYLVERALKNPSAVSPELKGLLDYYHELNVVNRGKFNYIINEAN